MELGYKLWAVGLAHNEFLGYSYNPWALRSLASAVMYPSHTVPRMAWVPKKGPTTLLFEASRRVLRVGDEVASWFG